MSALTPEQRAEMLWEDLGGEMCICQMPDVPHWCEKCQQRMSTIAAALRAALVERTCGNCQHWTDLRHVRGPRVGVCSSEAHRYNDDGDLATHHDDGCRKGWTPRQTETTP